MAAAWRAALAAARASVKRGASVAGPPWSGHGARGGRAAAAAAVAASAVAGAALLDSSRKRRSGRGFLTVQAQKALSRFTELESIFVKSEQVLDTLPASPSS